VLAPHDRSSVGASPHRVTPSMVRMQTQSMLPLQELPGSTAQVPAADTQRWTPASSTQTWSARQQQKHPPSSSEFPAADVHRRAPSSVTQTCPARQHRRPHRRLLRHLRRRASAGSTLESASSRAATTAIALWSAPRRVTLADSLRARASNSSLSTMEPPLDDAVSWGSSGRVAGCAAPLMQRPGCVVTSAQHGDPWRHCLGPLPVGAFSRSAN
jgi:hypothetical protein